jgi:hypothetical protein
MLHQDACLDQENQAQTQTHAELEMATSLISGCSLAPVLSERGFAAPEPRQQCQAP